MAVQTTVSILDATKAPIIVNTIPGVGSAGVPATDVTTVQGAPGGTPVNMIRVAGGGPLTAMPAASANGTPLGTLPATASGVRVYLGTSDSLTFTVASEQPTSPPTVVFTISGALGGTGPNWDESLSSGQMLYVTAVSGSPVFRWY